MKHHDIILLVEDNPSDVLLIQRAFRKANVSVPLQAVGDKEAAVSYLSGQEPYGDRIHHPLQKSDGESPRLSSGGWTRANRQDSGIPIRSPYSAACQLWC